MDDIVTKKKKKSMKKIVASVIKWSFLGATLLMIGWLTLRGVWMKGTAQSRRMLLTEAALSYRDELSVWELPAVNEASNPIDETRDKLFFIGRIFYVEQTDGLQFMLRYNANNADEYPLLDGEDDRFVFELVDDAGRTYQTYSYTTDQKVMYRFYRVCFEGVDMAGAGSFSVNIYYNGAHLSLIDRCLVWNISYGKEPYIPSKKELSGADIEKIRIGSADRPRDDQMDE